jgi:hypothetical protein
MFVSNLNSLGSDPQKIPYSFSRFLELDLFVPSSRAIDKRFTCFLCRINSDFYKFHA